jgi:ABC-2 type transport system permease protein
MKHLLYKELNLSIHPFFVWILPLIISLLFFIPNWVYTIVFMYFFWISVPQIFQGYNAQQDQAFISTLPVTKKSIVYSKIMAFIILQLIHLGFGAIMATLHVLAFGSGANFVMDINPALFGAVMVVYASFNIVFLPGYFRTSYRYGVPLIIGVIVSLLVATFFEMGTVIFPWMTQIMKSDSIFVQLGVLFGGIIIFLGVNLLAVKWSYQNYRKIK